MPNALPIAEMSLPAKVIEHAALTNVMLQKAASQEKQAAAVKSAVAKAIPGVVDALITHSRIRADEREKLASKLSDPLFALQMLQKLAGHRNADEMGRLGTPVGEKTASTRGAGNPHVGGRTNELKESDIAFFRGAGLAVPSA